MKNSTYQWFGIGSALLFMVCLLIQPNIFRGSFQTPDERPPTVDWTIQAEEDMNNLQRELDELLEKQGGAQ